MSAPKGIDISLYTKFTPWYLMRMYKSASVTYSNIEKGYKHIRIVCCMGSRNIENRLLPMVEVNTLLKFLGLNKNKTTTQKFKSACRNKIFSLLKTKKNIFSFLCKVISDGGFYKFTIRRNSSNPKINGFLVSDNNGFFRTALSIIGIGFYVSRRLTNGVTLTINDGCFYINGRWYRTGDE